MRLDSHLIEKLKAEFGESFYLLDSIRFRNNFIELRQAFNEIYPNTNIAYSYKTNYIPKFCKVVNDLGGYAEVVSEMELEIATRIGCRFNKIIWNGPVKNVLVMEDFLIKGGTINIDSLEELEFVKAIHNRHSNVEINVGIRCNYDVNDGVISRFGFDIEKDDFKHALEYLTTTKNIKLINFQCHFAKRNLEYWAARANGMIRLIDSLGIIPERIDIGGGLYGKMHDSLKQQFQNYIPNYNEYAKVAATPFKEYFSNKKNYPELLIEPGSAIVGDCMNFVATIKTIKQVRNKFFATIMGSQKNISMANVNPPIEIIPMGMKQKKYTNIDFAGYTCIENDILYRNYSGSLAQEDVVIFGNCGSYSVVMKPPFILPNFPILDICGDNVDIVKRQEKFDDLFITYNF